MPVQALHSSSQRTPRQKHRRPASKDASARSRRVRRKFSEPALLVHVFKPDFRCPQIPPGFQAIRFPLPAVAPGLSVPPAYAQFTVHGNMMASLLIEGDTAIVRTDRPARPYQAAVVKLWTKEEVMVRVWVPNADRSSIDLMTFGARAEHWIRIEPSQVEWALEVIAVVRLVRP